MKYSMIVLTTIILLTSCKPGQISENIEAEAMKKAIEFASGKVDSAVIVTDNNGVVSIGDELVRFVINPENIFHAEIDEHHGKDVLVTIDSLHDPYLMPAWHLIFQKDDATFKMATAIHSDIRILQVEKGILTAEIPTHTRNSPMYYCSECRDTVDYRIRAGKLEVLKP